MKENKQKQIEEMVDVIAQKCEECLVGCYDCDCCNESKAYCRSRCHATVLYNAGYRKIPEGAVVLTGTEKKKLLHEMYEQGKFDAIADLEKDGKVVLTAKELEKMRQGLVAEVLTKILGFCTDKEVGMIYLIKRTAKEYGVEL